MRRRELIALLGGAAAWPLAAHSQQDKPVIGWMSGRAPEDSTHLLAAFHQGLREAGFVDGQNVSIEYRWARGQYEKLPALASDLVSRGVAVLVGVGGDVSAVAAKQATATISIVFGMGAQLLMVGRDRSWVANPSNSRSDRPGTGLRPSRSLRPGTIQNDSDLSQGLLNSPALSLAIHGSRR